MASLLKQLCNLLKLIYRFCKLTIDIKNRRILKNSISHQKKGEMSKFKMCNYKLRFQCPGGSTNAVCKGFSVITMQRAFWRRNRTVKLSVFCDDIDNSRKEPKIASIWERIVPFCELGSCQCWQIFICNFLQRGIAS